MTVSNAQRFLTAFNRIEKSLQKIVNKKEYVPFSKLVQIARWKHPVIEKHAEDLHAFAELRNALVHDYVEVNFMIAEPHEQVVQLLEKIDVALAEPKLVSQFCSKEVKSFQLEDDVQHLLNVIGKHHFATFPIYKNGQFQGLLTANAITAWLAQEAEQSKSIVLPKIATILQYEKRKNYAFIARDRTLFDAQHVFQQSVLAGKRIEALLVTANGEDTQRIEGIITPIDLVNA